MAGLLLIGPTGTGCRFLGWGKGGTPSGQSPPRWPLTDRPRFASTSSDRTEPVRVVGLTFDVVRIDLPVGEIHHGGKIWNHVDEGRVEASLAALLARNGLRVGVATPDAWPALATIIEAAGGTVRREELSAPQGQPLLIRVGTVDETESIFTHRRGGRLEGKTFSAGDKLLSVDYWYHPELGGTTDVRLQLEIRRDRGVMTWEREGGILRQVPAYDRTAWTELVVPLTLRPDEFAVIGLGDRGENAFLPGSRFFTSQQEGRLVETFYCLTPHPYEVTAARRKPPA